MQMAFLLLDRLRLTNETIYEEPTMSGRAVFTGLTKLLTLLLLGFTAKAQVIGPSVQELKYSYTAEFSIPADAAEQTDEDRANFHASHLFGIFQSPSLVKKYGVPSNIYGIGAPRSQMKIKILSSEVDGKNIHIRYRNTGKMLFHKVAAAALLAEGQMTLPLPNNPYEIYDKKCTDPHYNTFGDYWYFYDIYRKGCTYLGKAPYATDVTITLQPTDYGKMQTTVQLPQLRGDNGNGKLFSIYVIHGFEADAKDKEDSGRINFNELNDYLVAHGWDENRSKSNGTSALYIYTKTIKLENGKELEVEIRHQLIETTITARSTVFAKFFQEAVENADVIVYGGHSGLGANLDIPSLEAKAGEFHFNPNKKQLFFFDSCSSYSYYLEHFAVEKTKAKIDVITNGLSSFFNVSNAILTTLIEHLTTEKVEDQPWNDVLQDMESSMGGGSFLLNVGGI
jgi:hypothetical protein